MDRKVLEIDTSLLGKVKVSLEVGGKKYSRVSSQKFGSQVLLDLVVKVIKQAGVAWEELTEVRVKREGNTFTGLRVGASVANAIGFGLGIPINGEKMEVNLKYEL